MNRFTDAQLAKFGAIALVVLSLALVAAFNVGQFPGLRGTSFEAEFSDASGLRPGNQVQVGGIQVGRVQGVTLDGPKAVVQFEVDNGVEFGTESEASIEVFNLLGDKFVNLVPVGEGQLDPDDRIPLERTEAAFDIVGVFSELTETNEQIQQRQLTEALDTLATTLNTASPEFEESFRGLTRISRTISSRDAELRSLLASSASVTDLLAQRSDDLVSLIGDTDLVLQELRARREAISRLLVEAQTLARELRGLATDNREQLRPALAELDGVLSLLNDKDQQIADTLEALGPYSSILSNLLGTGPWYDALVINLLSLPTGEFIPFGGGPS